jgi:hypothetical protein
MLEAAALQSAFDEGVGGIASDADMPAASTPDPYRLLRASERTLLGRSRIFSGLGQMQPVIIGQDRGGLTLRIEDVEDGRPCWRVLPLPRYRKEAKRLFAQLEDCHRRGVPSPATLAWNTQRPLS